MANPIVQLKTNKGDIKLELDADKAPNSVVNFLQYVEDGFYSNVIFHRVIPGFMAQGGGFDTEMQEKETHAPIENEANNGLKNNRGTIAYARTGDPHSATAQFFINLVDNDFLNFTSETPRGWGYAVFGKVIEGMEVVDAIAAIPTGRLRGMGDVPKEQVVIESAEVVEEA
ncbi:MAG TPA: peptidylprolyl isomerase [Saprospiraceae bacterium]|nr:peptidylprolyl isomerase [Saprospiraceae bacterium]